MELRDETITFFTFIIVGIIIGIVFDFFRAIRKVKKYKEKNIYIQDIIFFLIIGIVLIAVLIYKLEDSLRLYLFFSLFLGIIIYASTISTYVIKIFIAFIKMSNKVAYFIFLPLLFYKELFMTLYNFFIKKIKKCCNKIYNMISYSYKNCKIKIHKIK